MWAIARLGARVPLYGPLNATVPSSVAERWIDVLIARPITPEIADAVVQMGARTDDPGRDIGEDVRVRVIGTLVSAGLDSDVVRPLVDVVPVRRVNLAQAFGESLPQGLTLRLTADSRID